MAYTKTNWVDEVLDGAERFEILKDGGAAVDAFGDLAQCRIQLETSVTTSGTALNATNLNKLETAMETIHANGAITNARLGADAVTGAKIADNAVDNEHIANDAIDSRHYVNGSIDTAHIANGQVTPDKTNFFNFLSSDSKIYAGSVYMDGTAIKLPSGWTCSRTSTGVYKVTHNLGNTGDDIIILTGSIDNLPYSTSRIATLTDKNTNDFEYMFEDTTGTKVNGSCDFILITYSW
jgi:hypothetical protein